MIYAWITSKALGLARYWWILAAAFLISGGYVWISEREKADDRRNQEIGAIIERETTQTEIIKNMETSNDARDEIRNDVGSARYDQCLRTSRTPASCERLLLKQ